MPAIPRKRTRSRSAFIRTRLLVLIVLLLSIGAGAYAVFRMQQVTPTDENTLALGGQKDAPLLNFDEPSLGYTLRLPLDYEVEKNGSFSRLYRKKSAAVGIGPVNFLYLSVAPNGASLADGEIYNYSASDVARLNTLAPGEKIVLGGATGGQAGFFTYRRIEDAMIGSYGAKGFVNESPWEFPAGTTEYRYLVPFVQGTYLVGAYTGESLTKAELDSLLTHLKLTPDTMTTQFTSPVPEGEWKEYANEAAGISLAYPGGWTYRTGSQQFPDGDLFALTVIGQTQRPQTELYDGVSFAVMKPILFTGNVRAWMRSRYEGEAASDATRPAQYSRVTYSGEIYEKVTVCGLGCFTYYHTVQNGKLYGFVVNAVGPNAAVYEGMVDRMLSSVTYH